MDGLKQWSASTDRWVDLSVSAEWKSATESQMVAEVVPLHRLLSMLMNTGSWVRRTSSHTHIHAQHYGKLKLQEQTHPRDDTLCTSYMCLWFHKLPVFVIRRVRCEIVDAKNVKRYELMFIDTQRINRCYFLPGLFYRELFILHSEYSSVLIQTSCWGVLLRSVWNKMCMLHERKILKLAAIMRYHKQVGDLCIQVAMKTGQVDKTRTTN